MKLVLNVNETTLEVTGYAVPTEKAPENVGQFVGPETEFHGSINPDTMTVYDWAFFQRANLGSKAGMIFNKPYIIRDPVDGRLLHAGDLATADVSQYKAHGGVLAQFADE